MTTFFPEIDIEKTKANARRKLREYPRWRRVANDVDGQKVTQTFTFDLRDKNGSPSKPVERLALKKVDAQAELDAIEYAVNNLYELVHRRILYEKFLQPYRPQDWEIYEALGYERSRFYELVDEALIAFAEQYRSSTLVVEVDF